MKVVISNRKRSQDKRSQDMRPQAKAPLFIGKLLILVLLLSLVTTFFVPLSLYATDMEDTATERALTLRGTENASAVAVDTWSDLRAAMSDNSVDTIYLAQDIQRQGGSDVDNDLPVINRSLTIDGLYDGQIHSLDFRDSSDSSDDSSAIEDAGALDGADGSEAVDSSDAVDNGVGTDSSEGAGSIEAADSIDAADTGAGAGSMEAADSIEGAGSTEAAEAIEGADTGDTAGTGTAADSKTAAGNGAGLYSRSSMDSSENAVDTTIPRPGFKLMKRCVGQFTLQNIDIIRPNGGSSALIAIDMDIASDSSSLDTIPECQDWQVSLSAISTSLAPSSGLIVLPAGKVNISGNLNWDCSTGSDPNQVVINASEINISGAETEVYLRNHNGDATAGYPTVQLSTKTKNIFSVSAGARCDLENLGQGATIVLDMSPGFISGNKVELNVSGPGTQLNIQGQGSNSHADGTDEHGGSVRLRAASGGIMVSAGAAVNVHAGASSVTNGLPAIIQEIESGGLRVDGEGTEVTIISDGAGDAYCGTGAFYKNKQQYIEVTNLARLTVIKTARSGGAAAPALHMGIGDGNNIQVKTGGQLYVENMGNGSIATCDGSNSNAAVEFAGDNPNITVEGSAVWSQGERAGQTQPSTAQLISAAGPAFAAPDQTGGRLIVNRGGVFIAIGNVDSDSHAIFSAGDRFGIIFNSPSYFNFMNTNPRPGALAFNVKGARSEFYSPKTDLAVWGNGNSRMGGSANATNASDNPIYDGPYKSWSGLEFGLRGDNFATVYNTNTLDFYSTVNSLGNQGMKSYRRVSGGMPTSPRINDLLQPTNADKYVRALATAPEGLLLPGRPIWTNELYGRFQITRVGAAAEISKAGQVTSLARETAYEAELAVAEFAGVMRYTDGNLLHVGDQYQVYSAWRASGGGLAADDPTNPKIEKLKPEQITTQVVTVKDVLPPLPAQISAPANGKLMIGLDSEISGTWTLPAEQASAQPHNTEAATSLYAVINSTDNAITEATAKTPIAGTLNSDGTWSYTLPEGLADKLAVGDRVYFVLADSNGNANPLELTAIHDTWMPAAPYLTVVEPDLLLHHVDAVINLDVARELAGLGQNSPAQLQAFLDLIQASATKSSPDVPYGTAVMVTAVSPLWGELKEYRLSSFLPENPDGKVYQVTYAAVEAPQFMKTGTITVLPEGANLGSFAFTKINMSRQVLAGVGFSLFACCPTDVTEHSHSWLVESLSWLAGGSAAGVGETVSEVESDALGCWQELASSVSDEAGYVEFVDLEPGDYMLVETQALPGYMLPQGQWLIIVADDLSVKIEAHGINAVSLPPAFSEGPDGELFLLNYQEAQLPMAGGWGVVYLTVIGIVIMGAGVLLTTMTLKRW